MPEIKLPKLADIVLCAEDFTWIKDPNGADGFVGISASNKIRVGVIRWQENYSVPMQYDGAASDGVKEMVVRLTKDQAKLIYQKALNEFKE